MSSRSAPPDIANTYSLLILNLSYKTTPDDLYPLFDRYGKVEDVFIPRDRRTGTSRGFAFVRFKYLDDAEHAVDRMDGKVIDGRQVKVKLAKYGRNEERIENGFMTSSSPKKVRRSRSPARRSRSPPRRSRSPPRRSSLSSRDYRRGRERYDRRDRSPERDGSRDRYRDRSRERFRDRRDRVRDHREPERNRDRSPDRYRRHRDSPDYERVRDRSSDRSDRSREVSPQNERGKRTPERKERVERSIDSRDDSRKSPGAVDEVQTEERENLSEKEEIVTRSPVDDVKPDVSPQKAEDFETEGKDEYEEPKSPADLQ